MSKNLDNEFMRGFLEAIFTTIFQPTQLPDNIFDLLDVTRKRIIVEFDRSKMTIAHDVVSLELVNKIKPEDVIDHYGDCRKALNAHIERQFPKHSFTMMYLEGDTKQSNAGTSLMELAIHVMIGKMLLMSQMNAKFNFTTEHIWIDITSKDKKSAFQVQSSVIIYPNRTA